MRMKSVKQIPLPAAANAVLRPSTPLRNVSPPSHRGTAAPQSFSSVPAVSSRETPSAWPRPLVPLQCKLAIGAANDSLEREADSMARVVMQGGPASPAPAVRRKCSCEGSGESCAACEEGKHELQRKTTGRVTPAEAPPIVHEVLQSPGQPLETATRSFMEPRFGHDFSHVRVHHDRPSAESARAIGAHAYASGNHVVFGAGKYRPESPEGQHLLAHELSHVVQQDSGCPAMLSRFKVEDCDAGNPMETSASVTDAHKLAMTMLQSAITKANTSPQPADVVQAAANHFKLALPPANPKDVKHWERVKTALSTMTKADQSATYECEPKQNWWNGGCISGVEAISLWNIHLCPLWWEDHPTTLDRAAILVHEWGHKWGKGINRIFETYRFDKGYAGLPTEKRLHMPDAFMGFVYELHTGMAPNF